MKKGDKLICLKTINNVFGQPLFEKGNVYDVLHVDTENVKIYVYLNHIKYSEHYSDFELEFILKNFKKI